MSQININDFIKLNIPDEKIFETEWLKNKFTKTLFLSNLTRKKEAVHAEKIIS